MRLKNTTVKYTVQFLACLWIFFCVFTTSSANAAVLFEDNFDESQADTWVQTISSPPPEILDYTTLNGNTVLRMTSIMSDGEVRGIYNLNTFNFSEGQIILDFSTMPDTDDTIDAQNKYNIDGLLSFNLYSPTYNPNGPTINFHIFGGYGGADRTAVIQGDGYFGPSESGIWDYDQDYRIVVTAVGETTNVSFRNTGDNVLFDHTFGFNLDKLDDFYIVLKQFMGTPEGEYYSDVALDYLRVSSVPIPSALWLLGSGIVGIVGIRRKFKAQINF